MLSIIFCQPSRSQPESSAAWSSIFSSRAAPLCTGHGEPCKQWTVNKCELREGADPYLSLHDRQSR